MVEVCRLGIVVGILSVGSGCGGGNDANNPDARPNEDAATLDAADAIESLASGQPGVARLVIDSTHVYWSTTTAVRRVPLAGGTVVPLVEVGYPFAIAVDEGALYWTDLNEGDPDNSSIHQLIGSTSEEITAGQGLPVDIAIDANTIIWANRDFDDHIVSAPRSGLASPMTLTGSANSLSPNLQRMTMDATTVYWTLPDSGVILQMPKTGGEPTPLASGQVSPYALTVAGDNVCWVNQGTFGTNMHNRDGAVRCIPKAGGTIVTLASGLYRPMDIVHQGGFLFWVNLGSPNGVDGSVQGVAIAGGEPEIIASNQGAPSTVAADATHVYWASGSEIQRRAR